MVLRSSLLIGLVAKGVSSQASSDRDSISLVSLRAGVAALSQDSAAASQLTHFETHLQGNHRSQKENRRISHVTVPSVGPLDHIQWLHIPKCGTSFINTIWGYACGQGKEPIDLNVDARWTPGCSDCHDLALLDRYPAEDYCRPGSLSSNFQTQHRPTSESAQRGEGANVVAFFRRPSQRMLSAFAGSMHTHGFQANARDDMVKKCEGNASCFARYPGVAGCQTRMLTGGHCADDAAWRETQWDGGMSQVEKAKQMVKSLAFVGLTDEWDESVCLFHRMFGGDIYTMEFHNVHRTNVHENAFYSHAVPQHDESVLGGFEDTADNEVYAAAKARFYELKKLHVGEGTACNDALPSMRKGQQLSCSESGAQCGVKGGVQCGNCPLMRAHFSRKAEEELKLSTMGSDVAKSTIHKSRIIDCDTAHNVCNIYGKSDDSIFLFRKFRAHMRR